MSSYSKALSKWCICGTICAVCFTRCNIAKKRRRRQITYQCTTTVLGKGSFGKVFLGLGRCDNGSDCDNKPLRVAIKRMRKTPKRWNSKYNSYLNEIRILNRLQQHPHVITLIGHSETPTTLDIVLELSESIDLFEYIQRNGAFAIPIAIKVFVNMVDTLHYLHSCNIVHRDIKPENLLYCAKTNTVKWIDFGHAKMSETSSLLRFLTTLAGSMAYNAPELLSTYVTYNGFATDVWSIGVTFYCMLLASLPFWANSTKIRCIQIHQGIDKYDHAFRALPTQIQTFLLELLTVDPKARWSTEQLYNHTEVINRSQSDDK